jgi:small subunit ribosomal protein S16
MALKIRLARMGSKKNPCYRIVVAEDTSPRDGKFIETLGNYTPSLPKDREDRVVVKSERAKYWLDQGAKPTERMEKLLGAKGIIKMPDYSSKPKKPSKKQAS